MKRVPKKHAVEDALELNAEGDGYLEFMVKNTGWGRSLANKVNKARAEQNKGRSPL